MDIDVPQPDHGPALDPRHDDVDQQAEPVLGTLQFQNQICCSAAAASTSSRPRDPDLRPGRQLRRPPAEHTVSCVDGVRLRTNGQKPAGLDDIAYLGATARGRAIWRRPKPYSVAGYRTRHSPKVYPEAINLLAQQRADRLPRTTWTSTTTASRGQADHQRAARLRDPGRWGEARTDDAVGRPVGCNPRRQQQPSRAAWTASPSRGRLRHFHDASAARSDGKVRAGGVPDGNIVLMTEEDFTGGASQSSDRRWQARTVADSLGGEPATNSTPAQPYRLNGAQRGPPEHGAPPATGLAERTHAAAPAASRSPGSTVAAASVVPPGPAPDRRVRRSRPAGRVGGCSVTGPDPPRSPSSLSSVDRLARAI